MVQPLETQRIDDCGAVVLIPLRPLGLTEALRPLFCGLAEEGKVDPCGGVPCGMGMGNVQGEEGPEEGAVEAHGPLGEIHALFDNAP